jgi:hypothetical protein|nr:MAG TPA: deoxyribosyltransferase [Bacteriophage sp.]
MLRHVQLQGGSARTIEQVLRTKKPQKKMNKKVYISGAIAHYDLEERKAAFGNAERFLALKGYNPVNPFKNGLPDEAHWREHMRADIALLLGCDYIYMLRGWELSKGAKLELDVASSCGIEVLFENQFNL